MTVTDSSQCFAFLSHNNLDKREVRQIAEALELDFGIPHFLDIYNIPVGEAFIPWIEKQLERSTGCAIFLGGHGWGPTHFWEAEKALARYRRDPSYKLIPVALPGIAKADMDRLGSGTLFQEINWADFTRRLDDSDALDKLRAALTGQPLPEGRGPGRLTPYQIRRDADRWRRSKEKDRSILYRGTQLAEAQRLVEENSDLIVPDEVTPFLIASAKRQQDFWRKLAIWTGVAAASITFFAVTAAIQWRSAENRGALSLSRQLALESGATSGADRVLLLSVQAMQAADTPEARRNLVARIGEWAPLRRMLHIDRNVSSVAIGGRNPRIFAGDGRGRLHAWDAATLQPLSVSKPLGHGAATAITVPAGSDEVWAGFEDGAVAVWTPLVGDPHIVRPAPALERVGQDRQILTMTANGTGTSLAAGGANGSITVFDRQSRSILADVADSDDLRIKTLAFHPNGTLLAAGTGSGLVHLMDPAKPLNRTSIPKFEGGVEGIVFTGSGETMLVTDGFGGLSMLAVDPRTPENYSFKGHAVLPPLGTSVAANAATGRIAVGDSSGMIFLRDAQGTAAGFQRRHGHATVVAGLAFDEDGKTLVSGASDGTIGVWDLGAGDPLAKHLPQLNPMPTVLRTAPGGTVIGAATTTGEAGVWRLEAGTWRRIVDLIAETSEAIGPAALEIPAASPSPGGFKELPDDEIPLIDMDRKGSLVAWTTRGGDLLWRRLDSSKALPIPLPRSGGPVGPLAVSPDGSRLAVVAANRTMHLFHLDQKGCAAGAPISLPSDVRSLAFTHHGDTIAVGLDDGRIGLWNARDGSQIGNLTPVHGTSVAYLLFTPDGTRLVSAGAGGGEDRTIAVVRVPQLQAQRLHSQQAGGSASGLATDGTGRWLAVPDHDGQVLLLDLMVNRTAALLMAGTTWIPAVAFEDAGRLVTASSDGDPLLWSLDLDSMRTSACEKAGRLLRPEEWNELISDRKYEPACDRKGL